MKRKFPTRVHRFASKATGRSIRIVAEGPPVPQSIVRAARNYVGIAPSKAEIAREARRLDKKTTDELLEMIGETLEIELPAKRTKRAKGAKHGNP